MLVRDKVIAKFGYTLTPGEELLPKMVPQVDWGKHFQEFAAWSSFSWPSFIDMQRAAGKETQLSEDSLKVLLGETLLSEIDSLFKLLFGVKPLAEVEPDWKPAIKFKVYKFEANEGRD